MTTESTIPRFYGANWEDLDRIAISRFRFLPDDDYSGDEPARCAYLASYFEGPAHDWAGVTFPRLTVDRLPRISTLGGPPHFNIAKRNLASANN